MTWGVPQKPLCCLDCMFKVTDLQSDIRSSHYWIRFSFTLKNSCSPWFCPHHGSLLGWYCWGLTGGHKVQPFSKLLPSLLLSFLSSAHRISKVQPDMFPIWILLDVQLQDDSWLFQKVFHSRMMENAGLLRTFSGAEMCLRSSPDLQTCLWALGDVFLTSWSWFLHSFRYKTLWSVFSKSHTRWSAWFLPWRAPPCPTTNSPLTDWQMPENSSVPLRIPRPRCCSIMDVILYISFSFGITTDRKAPVEFYRGKFSQKNK